MTEPMDRPEEPELVDPGSKTQPAEGGREEVEESLDRTAASEASRDEAEGS